ncbi:MAG TPA: transposase, partial [Thiobacillaceae bacterium]|nr:transposase [Thiobacillaceae bacterium]HNU65199.1 transposase [Thiobacillaceae bacterium]
TTGLRGAGYTGVQKREENRDTEVEWNVAMTPGKRRVLPDTELGRLVEQLEVVKARIRARVAHPFRVIKRQFGHVKNRYRGLAKNTAQLVTLFMLSNLWMARRRWMATMG